MEFQKVQRKVITRRTRSSQKPRRFKRKRTHRMLTRSRTKKLDEIMKRSEADVEADRIADEKTTRDRTHELISEYGQYGLSREQATDHAIKESKARHYLPFKLMRGNKVVYEYDPRIKFRPWVQVRPR